LRPRTNSSNLSIQNQRIDGSDGREAVFPGS
jgi:hypothetical protein